MEVLPKEGNHILNCVGDNPSVGDNQPTERHKKKGPLLNTLWLHVATVSLLQEAFLQQRYECPKSMEAERMIFWMAAACA